MRTERFVTQNRHIIEEQKGGNLNILDRVATSALNVLIESETSDKMTILGEYPCTIATDKRDIVLFIMERTGAQIKSEASP